MRTKHFSRYGRKLSLAAFLFLLLISGQRAWTQEVDTAQIVWTTKLSLSDEIWAAKFFANGDSIVVVEKNRVFVMDARTGKIGDVLNGFKPYKKIEFEDGKPIIYNNWQKYNLSLRKVLDTVKFEPFGSAPDHLFGIGSFALHPKNDIIYLETSHTSSPWGPNRVLDSNLTIITKSKLQPIHFKSINAFMNRGVEVSRDGRFLITGELNTACCIGNIATNEIRMELRNPETLDLIKTIYKQNGIEVYSKAFSPDSKYFVATTYDEVYIWETDKWELLSKFRLYYIQFGDLCFSCNSKFLLAQYIFDGEEPRQYGMNIYSLQPEIKKIRKLILNYTLPDGTMPRIIPKAIDCENNKMLAVTVVYDNGYKWALSLIQLPEFVTSVDSNNTTDNDAILYPNPTNGTITINFNEELTEPTTMELSNETGRILFSTIIGTGTRDYLLNTRELPEGMYICNVRSHNFTRTYKIMVVR